MWPLIFLVGEIIFSSVDLIMSTRSTISNIIFPNSYDFISVVKKWNKNASEIMLRYVWEAYDVLKEETFTKIDWNQTYQHIEVNITQLFEPKIRACMSGFEPFFLQHGPFEFESRSGSKGQPPQYDIAFIWKANPRIMWPLEAKVLKSDGDLSEYIKEIHNNFLTCRYAPFSSEGAMLGYLLKGTPDNVFRNIERKLPCTLIDHIAFPERDHKISDHKRVVPASKNYSKLFRCNHLILLFAND